MVPGTSPSWAVHPGVARPSEDRRTVTGGDLRAQALPPAGAHHAKGQGACAVLRALGLRVSLTRVGAELRRLVVNRAQGLCEYCLIHEADAWSWGRGLAWARIRGRRGPFGFRHPEGSAGFRSSVSLYLCRCLFSLENADVRARGLGLGLVLMPQTRGIGQ